MNALQKIYKVFHDFLFGSDEQPTEEQKQKERMRRAMMLGARGEVTFKTKKNNQDGSD